MKKVLAILIALIMILAAIPALAEAQEEVTLTFGSIWSSETESNRAPFMKAIEQFEAEYPWIHVNVDYNEAEAWKTKIKTLVAANEAPDVFYYNAGGLLKSFVDAGKVLPLNDYIDGETMARLVDGTLTNMTFDGKFYGMPYTIACSIMYCNTELFEKYEVKIPETWTELMDAVKVFKDAGLVPMAVGGKDRWPTNMYNDLILLRAAGFQECYDAFYKTENGSFESEGIVLGAEKFTELIEAGAFSEACVALTRDESEVPFYAGEIPMYINGQWTAANCQADSSAIKGKTIAVRFPAIEGGKGDINDFMGGAAEQFCVSANTQHVEEAVLLCQFVAEHLSENGYLAGAGLPAWKTDVDVSDIDPLIAQIAELTKGANSFLLWGNTALEGNDSELLMDAVTEQLAGDITPAEFCEQMQTVFEN